MWEWSWRFPPTNRGQLWILVAPSFSHRPTPSFTHDLPRRSLHSGVKDQFSHLALAEGSFDVAAPVNLFSYWAPICFRRSWMSVRCRYMILCLVRLVQFSAGFLLAWSPSLTVFSGYSSLVSLTKSIEFLIDRFWHVEEHMVAPLQYSTQFWPVLRYHYRFAFLYTILLLIQDVCWFTWCRSLMFRWLKMQIESWR